MATGNAFGRLDLLLIHPGGAHGIYGDIGGDLIAVEPPLWPRLIAGYCLDREFTVKIIDAEAERLSPREVAEAAARLDPQLACLCVYGHQPSASTQQMDAAGLTARAIKEARPEIPVMMLGGHVSALPERTLREEAVDFVCSGEGPITVAKLLFGMRNGTYMRMMVPGLWWMEGGEVQSTPAAPLIEDLGQLHGDAWHLLPMDRYRAHNWQCFGDLGARQPYASIYTSLGCPYKCLSGDTTVNTIYGKFTIRALAECFGDRGVPVYTYDPEKRRVFVADGIKIRKYGSGERLVRVRFDDGTHIDCTPDHQFLQFKWGNGKSEGRQWACEAKDLQPGAHVRAVRFEESPTGRVSVTWGRRDRQFRSRMIMEYLAERDLITSEQVHHEDRNKANDHPSNLELCASVTEHFKRHPEIAERMRVNNPTRNGMGSDWRDRISAAGRGKIRSDAARQRYRESKLGDRNPNFRHGQRTGTKSRLEVNHRVVSVEALPDLADVYCLSVPETGWFFANNVLVENCSFCCINAPFKTNRYRTRHPGAVVGEIVRLRNDYGVRTFKIVDEMFVLKERHYAAICEGLIDAGRAGGWDPAEELNIWAYARVDTIEPAKLALLRSAGFRWLAIGVESGSAHVRDGAKKAMREADIMGVVSEVQAAGINVIANYIFGLPDDDMATMRETLDLALELNTEFANFYSAMAYPGSPLYDQAIRAGWTLPASWRGYSQHNDDCRPLDTKHVMGAEVLRFRDQAFTAYFTSPNYLRMIEQKFGAETLAHVCGMTGYKLRRKLLEAA